MDNFFCLIRSDELIRITTKYLKKKKKKSNDFLNNVMVNFYNGLRELKALGTKRA